MPTEKPPIVIKKYANRRLYHTGTSTYVTLEDLAQMVKAGEDFVVYDAKTSEEITRSVLTQIIFEQENKEGGQNLLPVTFLRQLIRFYGDSMQSLVPSYLESSMNNFAREQQKLRDQIAQAFGPGTFQAIDDHVRANMAFFTDAMRMFTPFAARRAGIEINGEEAKGTELRGAELKGGEPPAEIDALKTQMAEMQAKLDALSRK
jgi:polyhydroxyalkanoate synthesis repressor PhaR